MDCGEISRNDAEEGHSMKIGFIGLGRMGRPMARNLMAAGHELTVHNRSQQVVDELVGEGARRAATPAEAARGADVVFTCLLTPDQVREVTLGPNGIAEGGGEGLIVVDCATIDPMTSRAVAAGLAERGIAYVDAPISGGPWGAEEGTLSIMVGGADETVAAVRPLLEILGNPEKIFHLGPVGSGTTAKICNQILTGCQHVLVAEVMVLGTKAGMDPERLFETLRASSGASSAMERAVPGFILPGKFDAAFAIEGIYKDLDCAIATAKALGVRLLIPAIAQQCFEEARGRGLGQEDTAAVIKPMEEIAGIQVRAAGKG
jgi:3-hydroxyisobutyrate dehydrogenase-like beta-hydroxyacid dehydrogenase